MNITFTGLMTAGVTAAVTTLAVKPFRRLAEDLYAAGYIVYTIVKDGEENLKRRKQCSSTELKTECEKE